MKNKIYGLLIYFLLTFPAIVVGAETATAQSSSGAWSVSNVSKYGLPSGTITNIAVMILNWLLFMLGIVGVIGFVISGIMYLIAAGDETLIGRAKKGMTYSIIGVIVGLAGVVIIQAINAILGGSSTTP